MRRAVTAGCIWSRAGLLHTFCAASPRLCHSSRRRKCPRTQSDRYHHSSYARAELSRRAKLGKTRQDLRLTICGWLDARWSLQRTVDHSACRRLSAGDFDLQVAYHLLPAKKVQSVRTTSNWRGWFWSWKRFLPFEGRVHTHVCTIVCMEDLGFDLPSQSTDFVCSS